MMKQRAFLERKPLVEVMKSFCERPFVGVMERVELKTFISDNIVAPIVFATLLLAPHEPPSEVNWAPEVKYHHVSPLIFVHDVLSYWALHLDAIHRRIP